MIFKMICFLLGRAFFKPKAFYIGKYWKKYRYTSFTILSGNNFFVYAICGRIFILENTFFLFVSIWLLSKLDFFNILIRLFLFWMLLLKFEYYFFNVKVKRCSSINQKQNSVANSVPILMHFQPGQYLSGHFPLTYTFPTQTITYPV